MPERDVRTFYLNFYIFTFIHIFSSSLISALHSWIVIPCLFKPYLGAMIPEQLLEEWPWNSSCEMALLKSHSDFGTRLRRIAFTSDEMFTSPSHVRGISLIL